MPFNFHVTQKTIAAFVFGLFVGGGIAVLKDANFLFFGLVGGIICAAITVAYETNKLNQSGATKSYAARLGIKMDTKPDCFTEYHVSVSCNCSVCCCRIAHCYAVRL
jgi:hypothetical protein